MAVLAEDLPEKGNFNKEAAGESRLDANVPKLKEMLDFPMFSSYIVGVNEEKRKEKQA